MRLAAALAAAIALTACAGRADSERTAARQVQGRESVVCSPKTFTVTFDPRKDVVVTGNGRTLATATFDTRSVSGACRRVQEPPLDHMGPTKVVYGRVQLRCVLARRPNVITHPVMGQNDEVVGNVLLVSDRSEPVVSAVLKNRGDARASRIYYATAYCTRA